MGRIYDITDKLTNDNPTIVISGKSYKVDNSKNTFLKIQKLAEDSKGAAIDNIITMALGEKAHQDLEKMNLSLSSYKNIITAIMAAVMEVEYEEAEKHFRGAKKPV